MKILTVLLFCWMVLPRPISAQSLRYPASQPYLALDAYSCNSNNPLSFTGNQAALAANANAGFGIYGERRFMLAATSMYCLAAALPTRLGNIGLRIRYAGFRNYNESSIGLAYARNLGARLSLGIQFNYDGYRIPAYQKRSFLNVEMGLIIQLTPKLQAGVQAMNILGRKSGKSNDVKPAAVYSAGMGYDVADHLFLGAAIVKEEDRPVNVLACLQYRFGKIFFAKVGVATATGSPFAGAGLGWKNLRLDISVSKHPQLGFSPGILLIMHFKQ